MAEEDPEAQRKSKNSAFDKQGELWQTFVTFLEYMFMDTCLSVF